MRNWVSYALMGLLFFLINLFLTYFQESYWALKDSLGVAVLFIAFLLILDGVAFYFRKKKEKDQ
ncbi:MAG TPA: hypothetical protein VK044_09550 [Virgibacillus sp.]|nr:hypothetical protein [Virgibacillus sp.]